MMRILTLVPIFILFSNAAYADLASELQSITSDEICTQIKDPGTCPAGAYPSVCAGITAADQSIIDQVNTTCSNLPTPTPDVSLWQTFLDGAKEYRDEIVGTIIAALLAALAWLKVSFNRLRAAAKTAFNRLADPFLKPGTKYDSRALNVILIGEGGSGKTTLIHSLTAAPEAVPEIATNSIETYSLVQEVTVKADDSIKRRLFRIFIDDYVGQNLVAALEDTSINERLKKIPAALPVIVVDLFPPDRDNPDALHKTINQARVDQQLAIYNDLVQQLILSRAKEAKDIVLFINKIDMISPLTRKSYATAEQAYKTLIDNLADVRGKRLHTIVGSARAGIGVVGYSQGRDDEKSLLQIIHDASQAYAER